MNKTIVLLLSFVLFCNILHSQERLFLWNEDEIPNSKSLEIKDSIADERIFQVSKPWIDAFFTSTQNNLGAAVLIIPGGGYARLAYEISGYELAKWFNTIGVNAFVLAHRLPHSPDLINPSEAPLMDAQQAMRVIRSNAEKWNIDINKIGVMGSSAGGHLAASLSTLSGSDTVVMPSFQILISPVIDFGEYAHKGSVKNLLGSNPTNNDIYRFSLHSQIVANTCPAFIVHAFDDKAVSPMNSILYYKGLLEKNISSSLHIFNKGGHSIALRNASRCTNMWTGLCEEWLKEINIIPDLRE